MQAARPTSVLMRARARAREAARGSVAAVLVPASQLPRERLGQ